MSSLSITSANQNGFQQLSSVMAKRNADQAEQIAQSLRKKADAAQAQADSYKEEALTLDSQANKAENNATDAHLKLYLSSAFIKAGSQVTNTINNAVVKQPPHPPQITNTTSTAIPNNHTVGSNVNIVV